MDGNGDACLHILNKDYSSKVVCNFSANGGVCENFIISVLARVLKH